MRTHWDKRMPPGLFKAKMAGLKSKYLGDPEAFHAKADQLLCQVLTDLGYEEGVKIYNSSTKWYA